MKTSSVITLAALLISGSAAAQQARTTAEGAAAPAWDVLLRARSHAPTRTSGAITAEDLKTRLYIFADDSMGGRLIAERTAQMMGDAVQESAFGWRALALSERSKAH